MYQIGMGTLEMLHEALPRDAFEAVEQVLVHRAFDFVCSSSPGNRDSAGKVDWKGSIDCTIYVNGARFTIDFYAYAISYMTATEATVHETQTLAQNGMVRITAPGYRAGPAGP